MERAARQWRLAVIPKKSLRREPPSFILPRSGSEPSSKRNSISFPRLGGRSGWGLVVVLLLASLSFAHGAEPIYKIRIGFPSLAFSYMPFYVAQEKGFLKKYGIEAEYIQMRTPIQPQAVVAGNINYFT